jgi:nucleotide-binding universal stress UspA family protein
MQTGSEEIITKVEKIVLAIDGSESSFRAAEGASVVAHAFKSSVAAVYVLPRSLSVRSGPPPDEHARQSLANAAAMLASYEGVTATSEIIEAGSLSVSEALVNYVTKENCDLVICGNQGLGGFRRLLLGSVSQNLVVHSTVSTLVVRAPPEDKKKIEFKKILVATDGSESAKKGVALATAFAKALSSKITFVNVIYLPPVSYTAGEGDWYESALKEFRADATKAVSDAQSFASKAGVDSDTNIVDNMHSPADALTKLAEQENYDLIIVGTRGLGGFKRLALGSVASGVVHYAHCSVLVAK